MKAKDGEICFDILRDDPFDFGKRTLLTKFGCLNSVPMSGAAYLCYFDG